MNAFQKQLLINGKTMAEVHNEIRTTAYFVRVEAVELPPPPAPVSIEEWEELQRAIRAVPTGGEK